LAVTLSEPVVAVVVVNVDVESEVDSFVEVEELHLTKVNMQMQPRRKKAIFFM